MARNPSEDTVVGTDSVQTKDHYIDSDGALRKFLKGFTAEKDAVCAVDTEADSLHSYREKLCLIQFTYAGEHAIIDPFEIEDFSPLFKFLEKTEVWMHGADFDMTLLKRTFGYVPSRVLDTQAAARLVGLRKFGLAALIEHFFDIKLSKQSQRADWGKRPLTEKLITYAINDVRYIPRLTELLMERLVELGREDWFYQCCENARQSVMEREGKAFDDAWRISGAGKLLPRGLCYLRQLWKWRDDEASRLDRPAFKVLRNEVMMELVKQLQETGKVTAPAFLRGGQIRSFWAAVKKAKNTPKDEWPSKRKGLRQRRTRDFDARFDKLKNHRDKAAHRLDLDPTIIAPKATLERIAADPHEGAKLLMPWQHELLDGAMPVLE